MRKTILAGLAVALVFGDARAQESRGEGAGAVLAGVRGRVLSRLADSANWVQAREGDRFFRGDAVRTLAVSRASLQFSDGSALELAPNTMLVVAAAGTAAQGQSGLSGLKTQTPSSAPKMESGGERPVAWRVQLSKEENFSRKDFDRRLAGGEADAVRRVLAPGRYFIRRAPVDVFGAEGPFSPPKRYEISRRVSSSPSAR